MDICKVSSGPFHSVLRSGGLLMHTGTEALPWLSGPVRSPDGSVPRKASLIRLAPPNRAPAIELVIGQPQ